MFSRRKETSSIKTKPLNKRLLSTVVVCCRLLSDLLLNINKLSNLPTASHGIHSSREMKSIKTISVYSL